MISSGEGIPYFSSCRLAQHTNIPHPVSSLTTVASDYIAIREVTASNSSNVKQIRPMFYQESLCLQYWCIRTTHCPHMHSWK